MNRIWLKVNTPAKIFFCAYIDYRPKLVYRVQMLDLIEPIQVRLSEMTQAQRRDVAHVTGVPFATVQKIAIAATRDPQVSTWAALARHFGMSIEIEIDQ